ncbi:MAG: type II secretion system protein [Patescibacteria group bacterium]
MHTAHHNQSGQTLLELIIAITVLVVALVATIVLIVTSINASREARNKLIATNLAREGVETVRNVRDSNWIDPTMQCDDPNCDNQADCTDSAQCDSTWGISQWDRELRTDDAAATIKTTAIPVVGDPSIHSPLSFLPDDFSETEYSRLRRTDEGFLQGGASIVGNSEFYRMLYLYPICQNAAGDQEYGTDNTSANDCPTAGYAEVGIQVVCEVRWGQHDSNKKVIIEDQLYNWQTL